MMNWAENEVKLACERERINSSNTGWEYGCACYESALKAFKSLLADDHSEMSISITKGILNRLIDRKCLTPIEDTPDVWRDDSQDSSRSQTLQCKRMGSLFKYIYPDGTVKYKDIDRTRCYLVGDHIPWSNGFIANLVDEMHPITMPYSPENKPYMVYAKEFLTDKQNGDYDTIHIVYVKNPDGTIERINRYFKESKNSFVEINHAEFAECKIKSKGL